MVKPVKIIEILSQQSSAEHIQCEHCDGTGNMIVLSQEAGFDLSECEVCLGTGYNQLGLILRGILKPPADGYGPVELREALANYVAETERKRWVQEANTAIRNAELAIAETQGLVDQAKAWLVSSGLPSTIASSAREPIGTSLPDRKIS